MTRGMSPDYAKCDIGLFGWVLSCRGREGGLNLAPQKDGKTRSWMS